MHLIYDMASFDNQIRLRVNDVWIGDGFSIQRMAWSKHYDEILQKCLFFLFLIMTLNSTSQMQPKISLSQVQWL